MHRGRQRRRPADPPEHDPPRGDHGGQLRRPPARRRGLVAHLRAGHGLRVAARARARDLPCVLSGAVVGAILGPAVFSPIFSGREELDAGVLTVPWLGAGVLSLVALVLALNVRPDPKRIGELIAPAEDRPAQPAAPLGAGLALLGGFVLDVLGVTALAFGAAALVLLPVFWIYRLREVGAGGFEPPKAEPTGLQPVPFGRSGTPPGERT